MATFMMTLQFSRVTFLSLITFIMVTSVMSSAINPNGESSNALTSLNATTTSTPPPTTTTRPNGESSDALAEAVFGDDLEGRSHTNDTRIVGGQQAANKQFPYQVALRLKGEKEPFCRGSILSRKWIITAAHCFVDEKNKDSVTFTRYSLGQVEVVAGGVTDLTSDKANRLSQPARRLVVNRMFYHNQEHPINDIALIRVDGDLLKAVAGVKPKAVTLPKRAKFVGSKAYISGYGEKSSHKPYLRYATVKILKDKRCKENYRDDWYRREQICAGSKGNKGNNLCGNGDRGSPLVVRKKNKKKKISYVLVGMYSSGHDCKANGPSIYTRVSHYTKFIRSVMNGTVDPGNIKDIFADDNSL